MVGSLRKIGGPHPYLDANVIFRRIIAGLKIPLIDTVKGVKRIISVSPAIGRNGSTADVSSEIPRVSGAIGGEIVGTLTTITHAVPCLHINSWLGYVGSGTDHGRWIGKATSVLCSNPIVIGSIGKQTTVVKDLGIGQGSTCLCP